MPQINRQPHVRTDPSWRPLLGIIFRNTGTWTVLSHLGNVKSTIKSTINVHRQDVHHQGVHHSEHHQRAHVELTQQPTSCTALSHSCFASAEALVRYSASPQCAQVTHATQTINLTAILLPARPKCVTGCTSHLSSVHLHKIHPSGTSSTHTSSAPDTSDPHSANCIYQQPRHCPIINLSGLMQ